MDNEEILLTLGYLLPKFIRKRREKAKNSRKNQWVNEIFTKIAGNERNVPYFSARIGTWRGNIFYVSIVNTLFYKNQEN